MTNEKTQPDFSYWCKHDKWDLKDAALLLHNLEPSNYFSIRFNSKEIPIDPKLREPHKTFLIMKKSYAFEHSNFAHPEQIFTFAKEKNLEVPEQFLKECALQYQRAGELSKKVKHQNQSEDPHFNDDLVTRERNTFLKVVGLMTHMLTKRSPRFIINDRPNAYQIMQAILEQADNMGVDANGLKSIDRKIKEAVEFLEQEKETEIED
jgi:hypothetical protein